MVRVVGCYMWKATLLASLGLRTAFRVGGALDRMALGMATNFLMVDGRNTNNVSETKKSTFLL